MNGDQFCRCLHIGLASRETLTNKRPGITSRQTRLLSFGTINSHLSTLYKLVSSQFKKWSANVLYKRISCIARDIVASKKMSNR